MPNIDSIVDVQISRETKAPSRTGFGDGAFVSNDAVFEERIKAYSELPEVQNDSLAGADTLAAATRYFGQALAPNTFYVIKKGRDLPHVQTLTFDGDFVASNSIALDIDGNPIGPTAFDTDQATTIGNLATAIAGAASVASAVVNPENGRQIIITGSANNTLVAVTNVVVTGGASQPSGTVATTQYPDALATIVDSIAAAQNDNDDWYGISIYSRVEADVLAVAAVMNAQLKLFFTASNDTDIIGTATDDIASQLQDLGYDRSVTLYSGSADGTSSDPYPEVGLMGGQLPEDPGSITWKFKQIQGVAPDNLTTTQVNNAKGKNCNVYVTIANLNSTQEGVVASGEYIDVIRGSDFIVARIQEFVFTVLINAKKVPYTNAGVALLENQVDQVLRLATNQGILAADPAYVITTVPVSQVPTTDKAARVYNGLSFVGTLAGAVHKTQIQGRLVL